MPLIVWITPKKNFAVMCLVLALSSAAARIVFARVGLGALIYQSTVTRMDGLILGGLAAFALREPLWRGWLMRWHQKIILIAAACVIASFVYAGNMEYSPAISDFGAFALAIVFSTSILRVALFPHSQMLNSRWLGSVGRRAYAMYLIHAPLSVFLTFRVQAETEHFL